MMSILTMLFSIIPLYPSSSEALV